MIHNRGVFCSFSCNKEVIPPEQTTALHFIFHRTVKVVDYFHQRNGRHYSLSSMTFCILSEKMKHFLHLVRKKNIFSSFVEKIEILLAP